VKIITVVGARPQFIKAAAVSRAIQSWNDENSRQKINELIAHTGQHYDKNMSDIFFKEMQIPQPHFNLEVGSGYHGEQTGLMLSKLESIFLEERPDYVLVYGDTNSTLAGSLAASKLHIPIAHIEAGLRSFNKRMPEEQNRVLTDHLSTILFCPTETAINNLKREGFSQLFDRYNITFDSPAIIQSGDVMYDCALFYGVLAEKKREIFSKFHLKSTEKQISPYVLSTIHRPENTDSPERLHEILSALKQINEGIPVILPLHPRTLNIIHQSSKLKKLVGTLKIIEPVSYLEMVLLEKNCSFICTDSGGVQKEAFFFKKPCITMRDQTEWKETVVAGWNVVTGGKKERILNSTRKVMEWIAHPEGRSPFQGRINKTTESLFGSGNSADKIVSKLIEFFSQSLHA
jgi:UDP-GlcNAc3NAcA epimerase